MAADMSVILHSAVFRSPVRLDDHSLRIVSNVWPNLVHVRRTVSRSVQPIDFVYNSASCNADA